MVAIKWAIRNCFVYKKEKFYSSSHSRDALIFLGSHAKVKFKISHLIGLYKIGHAQLFNVHRRKTLYFTWHSWNTFEFSSLSCKHALSMIKLMFNITVILLVTVKQDMRNCFVYIEERFYSAWQTNHLDFPSLSCKSTLSMNKLKLNNQFNWSLYIK